MVHDSNRRETVCVCVCGLEGGNPELEKIAMKIVSRLQRPKRHTRSTHTHTEWHTYIVNVSFEYWNVTQSKRRSNYAIIYFLLTRTIIRVICFNFIHQKCRAWNAYRSTQINSLLHSIQFLDKNAETAIRICKKNVAGIHKWLELSKLCQIIRKCHNQKYFRRPVHPQMSCHPWRILSWSRLYTIPFSWFIVFTQWRWSVFIYILTFIGPVAIQDIHRLASVYSKNCPVFLSLLAKITIKRMCRSDRHSKWIRSFFRRFTDYRNC